VCDLDVMDGPSKLIVIRKDVIESLSNLCFEL
jgi:hypothetical protein